MPAKLPLTLEQRLEHFMSVIDKRRVLESVTFGTNNKTLYKRLHTCIGNQNRSKVIRELIDIGLKVKGY